MDQEASFDSHHAEPRAADPQPVLTWTPLFSQIDDPYIYTACLRTEDAGRQNRMVTRVTVILYRSMNQAEFYCGHLNGLDVSDASDKMPIDGKPDNTILATFELRHIVSMEQYMSLLWKKHQDV